MLQRAAGGRQDAAQDRQQRGLAAARGAHQQGQLARHQVDVDALERPVPAPAPEPSILVMSLGFEHGDSECVMVVVSGCVSG